MSGPHRQSIEVEIRSRQGFMLADITSGRAFPSLLTSHAGVLREFVSPMPNHHLLFAAE